MVLGGELKPLDGPFDPSIDMQQYAADYGLCVWSDASFNSKTAKGQMSYCGHVIMRGNGAVCWASRKLKAVALSSTEAEICAGVAATKDIIFVRNVLTFMGAKPAGPTPLLIDNEGMWFNVRNAGVSARTRHWELWQQFVREAYSKLTLTV